MKTWERWTCNLGTLAVVVSGCAYFWMKHVATTDDPFAVVNHPWQAAMLNAHVLAGPPLILILGMILNSHIMKKLGATRIPNRRSGLLSLGTFAAMVASGYLLQVTVDAVWLRALVIVHVATSVVFTAAYGAHLVLSARLARRSLVAVREVA